MVEIDAQRRSYQASQHLKKFWDAAHRATRLGRRDLLRRYAMLKLDPDPYLAANPSVARHHFEKRKSRGHYRMNGACWCCRVEPARERHHIIALAHGGPNRTLNIVKICAACHDEIHPWLKAHR
jgi:5-methylcytosine-specific restriction endonuclease McrA